MTKKVSVGKYKPTKVENERRHRIRLSVAAYAYEFHSDPIMSDAEFDELSLKINKNIKTGNKVLDKFFVQNFDSCTGMWIHHHPEKQKLEWLYRNVYKKSAPKNKKLDKPENSIYTWHKLIES